MKNLLRTHSHHLTHPSDIPGGIQNPERLHDKPQAHLRPLLLVDGQLEGLVDARVGGELDGGVPQHGRRDGAQRRRGRLCHGRPRRRRRGVVRQRVLLLLLAVADVGRRRPRLVLKLGLALRLGVLARRGVGREGVEVAQVREAEVGEHEVRRGHNLE